MVPSEIKPFVVMAKPVGPACNLRCSYCYYLETRQLYPSPHSFMMSDLILENYIRQYIESSPGPSILFVWHGGEPALAGIDFYHNVLELQKRYLPHGWKCWNNLQTNGLLLDDSWCTFLAEAKFDVGVSIDGTQFVHDNYRKDNHGNSTYQATVAAIRRLQSHGIQPDLLCTVTSIAAKDPSGVYRALKELDTGWIQFIPIIRRTPDGQITRDSVSSEAYGRFLSVIFYEWILHDLDKLNIQFFAEISLVWSGGNANPCWMSPTCGRVLIVEHDGSVYSCDHFVNPEHRLGNIDYSSLIELLNFPAQQQFGENKRLLLPNQCRSCRWLEICNGGCPKDRFSISDDGAPGLNYLCKGLRKFFSQSEVPIKKVIARRKQGKSPAAIISELRADLAARWKGIGRNDPCPCGSGMKAKQCCWYQRP